MKMPRRGEKGFTLIELLIVVAILGVLAAVVIPNVGRFIGRGETEAAKTELTNIQSAVVSMMIDNNIDALPVPRTPAVGATNDMSLFPDASSNGTTKGYQDNTITDGYILYEHDLVLTNTTYTTVNYVATQTTKGTYTCDAAGTVNQTTTGY